jgi:hypothetical protein
VQLSPSAMRFLLPGQSYLSEVLPPHLPSLGGLLPKLRFLPLRDSNLRVGTFADCSSRRYQSAPFQPVAKSRQFLGHHRLTSGTPCW